jgi:hypothetical protein
MEEKNEPTSLFILFPLPPSLDGGKIGTPYILHLKMEAMET